MKDISYREALTLDKELKIIILIYNGEGDPVKHLDEAVVYYDPDKKYREFVDANMDNPWIRILAQEIGKSINISQI